jgi:prephenate dehydratase
MVAIGASVPATHMLAGAQWTHPRPTRPAGQVIDVGLDQCRAWQREFVIATLGPTGTSSEVAARRAAELVEAGWNKQVAVRLYSQFENAADAVRAAEADAVVVANAYDRINHMYMDPDLELVAAFVHPTPDYGLAARPASPLPLSTRITTHPAPLRLISQLLPVAFTVGETVVVSSTSIAARMVAEGLADLALTNETSRREYGLTFVSPTRPIRMLWSVFMRSTVFEPPSTDAEERRG